ncbi:uncharacterized protein LOC122299620 [Carya illinoinensis]|uniref:uncharacterized protein LOC122299620 n=1 Tax=Carya illinoinensis TaxID=32201 RepID=UPI001C71AE6C|nr:uncharacterized protein LOC122299620 [Carya illinoinensis]
MKTLSWNSRGLGNPRGIRNLRDLVRKEDPDILFIQETRLRVSEMDRCKRSLGLENCLAVSCEGRRGGLALFWKLEVDLTILQYSKNHIHAIIAEEEQESRRWFLTGIYGFPEVASRHLTWTLMRSLKNVDNLGWLLIGDFNEIIHQAEKWGGVDRPEWQMKNFRDAIDDCGIKDLGYQGCPYTWSNRRGESECISARLDRALANEVWCLNNPLASVIHGSVAYSDHTPLWVDTTGYQTSRRGHRPFRFESMWSGEEGCSKLIKEAWRERSKGDGIKTLMQWTQMVGEKLKVWNKKSFGNVKVKLAEAKENLSQLQKKDPVGLNSQENMSAREEVNKWLGREEEMWHQRSKALWIQAGDQNSRYFHSKASHRKKKNTIKRLQDEQNQWKEGRDMEELVVNYFQQLFSSSEERDHTESAARVESKVTSRMNEELKKPFTAAEVNLALSQMHPTKAPGPDGMPPLFYQKYWSTIGSSVSEAVLESLNTGVFPKELNHSFICLIPKKQNPTKVVDFRPISLCNVLYKLMSKAIANRLKALLPMLISASQSAFVPGRLITDNVLVAYEIVHFLRHRRGGKKGYMSIKLDMSKAYDRVEWDFLERIMVQMGFETRWINLIMYCVTSVFFSVMLNGVPTGCIKPTRGLRQGDPLSPYLFLLCTEGLVSMLKQAALNSMIPGIRICRGAPTINHLLFADDSVIFCKADVQTNLELQRILKRYELASGQKLNMDKTSMVFSSNVSSPMQEEIRNMWGGSAIQQYEKYLGLPPMISRKKANAFSDIKSRVWKKLQCWKEKQLSQGGKEILLKAVALAIPTYAMSCFKLPDCLFRELESLMARFWWGRTENNKRIHWVSWKNLCKSKYQGGLGFKELKLFNTALLAKQGWRLVTQSKSLLYQVFKAKYFPKGEFLDSKLGHNPSYAWRGIWETRVFLKQGCQKRVGDGKNIRIWHDYWIPGHRNVLHDHSVEESQDRKNETVDTLINGETRWWDISKVRALFNPIIAEKILKIVICPEGYEDRWMWSEERSGEFSVRSAYKLLQKGLYDAVGQSSNSSSLNSLWKAIWKMKLPLKIRIFAWKLCKDCLPTGLNLIKRHVDIDPKCCLCAEQNEDLSHAIVYCPQLIEFWKGQLPKLFDIQKPILFIDLINHVHNKGTTEELQFFCLIAWSFWYRRNRKIHDLVVLPIKQVVDHALSVQSSFVSCSQQKNPDHIKLNGLWSPPPEGFLKLNVDGALFFDQKKAGIGAVLRDGRGEVILAASKMECYIEEPETIELVAILRGLQLCIQSGISKLVVESDCKLLVEILQQEPQQDASQLGNLTSEVKRLMSLFEICLCKHVSRVGNRAAHKLARMAWNVDDLVVWGESVPEPIAHVIWVDKVSCNP